MKKKIVRKTPDKDTLLVELAPFVTLAVNVRQLRKDLIPAKTPRFGRTTRHAVRE